MIRRLKEWICGAVEVRQESCATCIWWSGRPRHQEGICRAVKAQDGAFRVEHPEDFRVALAVQFVTAAGHYCLEHIAPEDINNQEKEQ